MSPFWSPDRVGAALGPGTEGRGDPTVGAFSAVVTDSRTLPPGALFVALRGERFDGHDFLDAAANAGARGAVVDRTFWRERGGSAPGGLDYFVVSDTLAALGRLAHHRRKLLRARVCGITGTNGKTTTKDMARAVLATRYRVHATSGNLNNLVGTPLTLLSAPDDVEAVVVEVGTNAPGEIARLTDITQPDAAILTVVSEGHLEGLSSVEGVLEEKLDLLRGLRAGSVALVGDEPPELPERARETGARVRVAGLGDLADAALRAEDLRLDEEGRVGFLWRRRRVSLRYRGRHNARNALLALGLGEEWGIEPDAAVEALGRLDAGKMRTQLERFGGLRVLVDCYNANPSSTEAAVELLASLPRGGGRVAVLGSMLELGEQGEALHRRTAERVAGAELDLVVATGDFADAFQPLADRLGERLVTARDPLDAGRPLEDRLTGDEVVLLKGSRGVALERLLPVLESVGLSRAAGQDRPGRGGGRTAGAGSGAATDRET